ncbi:MAG TPA: hypothetical protein VF808_19165 [Ktedonobacterales bacterium]
MRNQLNEQARGLALIIIWLLDAGVGIGLYGQGHFALAMLTLAFLPIALVAGIPLLAAALTWLARLAGRGDPDERGA